MRKILAVGIVGLLITLGFSFFAFYFGRKVDPVEKKRPLDLGQLFYQYGSDKDRNSYTPLYHALFDHLKEQPVTLLEIGIGTMIPGVHSTMNGYALHHYKPGGSLRAWRDYFVNGTIIGCDVQKDTQFSDEKRIKTYICNSTDKSSVEKIVQELGSIKFDIIIDDGSHLDTDQLMTLSNLYPYLKENGIYIIEDIYPSSRVSANPSLMTSFINGDPYFFLGPYNNICVIYKNHLQRNSYPEIGRP